MNIQIHYFLSKHEKKYFENGEMELEGGGRIVIDTDREHTTNWTQDT